MNAKQQDPYHPSTSKSNFPHDYKPNINDLRQLFDDNSRHHAEHKKHHSSHRRSGIYADAKPTTAIDENLLELKNANQSLSIVTAAIPSTRNIEFERVKQKFDKPPNATGSSARNKKARNFSSFLKFSNKRNECVPNETDASKLSNTVMAAAINGSSMNEDASIGLGANEKTKTNERLTVNKKKDAYMNSSMNLDGLKVSEDDDDDDVSKCQRPMRSTPAPRDGFVFVHFP